MTPRYTKAICLAAKAHEGQIRKGTAVPYITHPVAVAALVAEYGGDEDLQIAALLHDVLEDGGPQYAPRLSSNSAQEYFRSFKRARTGYPTRMETNPRGRKESSSTSRTSRLRQMPHCWSPAATS